jgi:hypothetical protein
MLKKIVQLFRQPRPQMRLQVMAEADKVAGFGEIPASRIWPALMAELDEFIIEVAGDALDEDNANKVFQVTGGQRYLLEFKRKLMDREQVARGLAKVAKDAKEDEGEEE